MSVTPNLCCDETKNRGAYTRLTHLICQQIWKTQQWPQDWERSIPKNSSAKECANHWTTALIFHAGKVMHRILHARLQHYVNQHFQMSKLGFEKEEEAEIKLPTSLDHRES